MKDYFVEHPTYHAKFFRRRFRMRRELFLRIQHDLLRFHGDKFSQKRDAVGKLGFSPEQKLTSALRILAYGSSADRNDEYIRMGESTSLRYLRLFCEGVIDTYGSFYLPMSCTIKDSTINWSSYFSSLRCYYSPPRSCNNNFMSSSNREH